MKDKLLSVCVNGKEIYYVKQSTCEVDIKNTKYYGVFNSTNNEIAGYTLDVNAYICAIELAMEEGKGNCVAVYPKEKRYFVNYEFVRSEEFT